MKVISLPFRLKLVLAFMALCIPLAGVEALIVSKAPWWKASFQNTGIWCCSSAIIYFVLVSGVIRGGHWPRVAVKGWGAVWRLVSAFLGLRVGNPALGFFTLILCAFWWVTSFRLSQELGRSFFDPQMKWYQGYPQPISGLTCELIQASGGAPLQVSRLDQEGTFVFSSELLDLPENSKTEMIFSFRNKKVRCPVKPIARLGKDLRAGAGFEFYGMSSDTKKDLGDFVEILQGEGYV